MSTPKYWAHENEVETGKDGLAYGTVAICKNPHMAEKVSAALNACEGIEEPSVVPEMLEALKTCAKLLPEARFWTCDGDYIPTHEIALVKSAIARAEGKSK